MTTQKLLQIKEKIDNAKTQQAEVKGQIRSIEDQIFTKFKVKAIDAVNEQLKERAEELDKMERDFKIGEEELGKVFSLHE